MSIFPKELEEAKSTKITVSLAFVITLVVGAFYAGRNSPTADLVTYQANQAEELRRFSRILERVERKQDELQKAVYDIQHKEREILTEIQDISSRK